MKAAAKKKCAGTKADGSKCQNWPRTGTLYCREHSPKITNLPKRISNDATSHLVPFSKKLKFGVLFLFIAFAAYFVPWFFSFSLGGWFVAIAIPILTWLGVLVENKPLLKAVTQSLIFGFAVAVGATTVIESQRVKTGLGELSPLISRKVRIGFIQFRVTDNQDILDYFANTFEPKNNVMRGVADYNTISIRAVDGILKLSAECTDSHGIRVKIVDNKWEVKPSELWSWNYDKTRFECLDNWGRVAFQVHVTPDETLISGRFFDGKNYVIVTPDTIVGPTQEGKPPAELDLFGDIEPLFQHGGSAPMGASRR